MPDWSKFEEMWKKTKPVRKVFGPLKHQTVPVFEDCLNYPIKDVVELANLSREIEREKYSEKIVEKAKQFHSEVARVTCERDKAKRWGLSLSEIRPSFTQ